MSETMSDDVALSNRVSDHDSTFTQNSSNSTNNVNTNLFFQLGMQSAADEEEVMVALQNGLEFQATYIVSESVGKYRDVVMKISLSGIRVSEPNNKKRTREFDIEQILQYSYNRIQERFTFAYLETDGILTNYRFMSKEFFDIHQALGKAIAMMVRVRGPELGQDEALLPTNIPTYKGNEEGQSASHLPLIGTPPTTKTPMDSNRSSSEPDSTTQQAQQPSTDPTSGSAGSAMQNFAQYVEAHEPVQEDDKSAGESIADAAIVVSGGDTDDNMSVYTVEGHQEFEQLAEGMDAASDMNEELGSGTVSMRSKNQKGSLRPGFSKTIRGWSLFGSQRSGSPTKNSRKSTQELMRIDENASRVVDTGPSESNENVNQKRYVPPALESINASSKRFGSMSLIEKRRGSLQDVFTNVPRSVDDKGGLRSAPARTLAHSAASLSEAAVSTNSVNSQVNANPEMPQVIKKEDSCGREILFKNLKGGKYEITAGTVDALVESLAEDAPPDTIYIEVFLLTFRHFMKGVELIRLLRQRFNQPFDPPQTGSIIRVRVVSVLKKWAERHNYDFNHPDMANELAGFLADIGKSDCAKYGPSIKSNLEYEIEKTRAFREPSKVITPPEIQAMLNSADFMTMFSPKRVAQELTLADLKLFRLIKPDEFCAFLWGDKSDNKTGNLNDYIARFNQIGFWVSTVICSIKDLKKRVEVTEKFIQVMKYLHKFQNYNTLMAILSGLNTNAISRLKKTWEAVQKSRSHIIYKEIETKLSYRGNFKAYREIEANSKVPFIPFFGLYIKDLTFMNDGNQKHLALTSTKPATDQSSRPPSFMKKQDGFTSIVEPTTSSPLQPIINFEKCRSITDKIHAIRVYQQSTFKFEEEKDDKNDGFFGSLSGSTSNPATDALLQIYMSPPYGPPAVEDEKKLLDMSRECEPSEKQYTLAPANANDANRVPKNVSGLKRDQSAGSCSTLGHEAVTTTT